MANTVTSNQDRLRAIELLLLWEGWLTSARLRLFFPVHGTQASRDFAAYRELAPDNIEKVWGKKGYGPGPLSKPVLTRGEFAEYARLIGISVPDRQLAQVQVEDIAPLHTAIKPYQFRAIHQAMAGSTAVQIQYASMTNPTVHKRVIFPHAMIHAGTRWHVRAWCAMRKAYRDFNLSRVSGAEATEGVEPADTPDATWDTIVKMRLVPHQELSPAQQRLVRNEFFNGTTALVLERRAALIPYVIRAYSAAVDPRKQRPPQYILQVGNVDDLLIDTGRFDERLLGRDARDP